MIHMRIWENMDRMGEGTYSLLSKGLLFSAALLGVGCAAIVRHCWAAADMCRDLSCAVLLLTVLLSSLLEKNE